jgi:DNA-binding winged helix-turn-helix (wHTH) protein
MTMVYIPWNSGGSLVDIAMKQIEPASALHFDPGDARLWVDGRESQLTPTQASMLRYFAFNSNRVISKQELLDMVWPDTHVTEALVKDYVRRLRRILDDDPSQPRFIETVRGIRRQCQHFWCRRRNAVSRRCKSIGTVDRRATFHRRIGWR